MHQRYLSKFAVRIIYPGALVMHYAFIRDLHLYLSLLPSIQFLGSSPIPPACLPSVHHTTHTRALYRESCPPLTVQVLSGVQQTRELQNTAGTARLQGLRNKDKQHYMCPGVKPARTINYRRAAAGRQLAGGAGGSTGQAVGQPEPVITEQALAPLFCPWVG